MLDDIFSDAYLNAFLWDPRVKVFTFQRSANSDMVPVTPLPKLNIKPDEAFHAEVLVSDDRSLIAIYESLEYIGPMYNFAPLEWNTTVCPAIKEDMVVVCVMSVSEPF